MKHDAPGDGNGRRRGRRLWVITAALAAVLTGAGTALAAVSATPASNNIGAAGYDATTTDPAGFTDNQAVVAGDQYGLQVRDGRLGVKLCNGTSHESAAIGEFSGQLNTTYAVQWGAGVSAGCPAGNVPTLTTFPALAAVPFGHHVWVDERVITRTRTIKLLVCVLFDRDNHPAPTPTPTGTGTPAPTQSAGAPTPTDTGSPTVNPVTPSPSPTHTRHHSESPSPSGSGDETSLTAKITHHRPGGDPSPGPEVTGPGALSGNELPGFTLRCHIVIRTITRHVLLFQAQDLDAPTVTPLAGDLAGVQTATVPFGSPGLPSGTVFDHASHGISLNTAQLTGCTGAGFPTALGGPAAYDSAACQPVVVFEYAAATIGSGAPQDFQALTTTEVIDRNPPTSNSANALAAPDNSIAPLNLGPHGPVASGAVTAGSHDVDFTGNVVQPPAAAPAP